jgi:universal stress protein A
MTPTQIQRILVPVDFSPDAESATSYALLLARALHANITLFHVVRVPSPLIGSVPGTSIDGGLSAAMDDANRRIDALVETVRGELANAATVSAEVVPSDTAAPTIVAHAATGYDLIVMGTHGRTGLSHLALGSVAESVVRTARCPVMTVRFSR